MAFIRKKKVKGYTYYYIVEGVYTKKGKLKQKVLRYLGNIEIRNIHATQVFPQPF